MSTAEDRSSDAGGDGEREDGRSEAPGGRHPGVGCRPRKEFYGSLGWRLDADFTFDNGFRIVQFTAAGSGASIQFGTEMTSGAPGPVQNLYLIVADIDGAREELVGHGEGQRGVPPRGAGRSIPCRSKRSPGRAGARRTATAPSPRSATRMATVGCCRRSRHDCLAASTLQRPHMDPRSTWPPRCGARLPLTATTRSGSARRMRTGPTGTPRTW
jgi:hypothetical protein